MKEQILWTFLKKKKSVHLGCFGHSYLKGYIYFCVLRTEKLFYNQLLSKRTFQITSLKYPTTLICQSQEHLKKE
ncbi:MAG: hypothetical protein EGP67_13095 [Bacteroidales bacterium]|nr:hypothetical protein [Bacteroidales bacterium]